jgi:DHA3 family tetracycline resistance protein-like MFS transporter
MPLFESLKHRSFTLLWSGQALSRLGDNVFRVALAWWVLEKTGSAKVMGTVFVLSYAPTLVFALIGGVAVDRFSRMHVMFAADLLRFFILAGIAILDFGHFLRVWHVYVASVILGTVETFFQPAYTAVLPDIIPRESLVSANSLTALSKQLAKVLGPVSSGMIVKWGSISAAFAANAASFLISAGCLVPMLRLVNARTSRMGESSVIRDLKDGLRAVASSPWLWITIVIASLFNVTQAGPYMVSLPFLVRDQLHADAGSLGLVYSMFAVGSVVATLIMNRFSVMQRRGLLAYGALITGGLMTLGLGVSRSFTSVFAFSLVLGGSLTVFTLIWVSTLQDLVPREFLGRVASIDNLGSYALLPLSYVLTGWATDRFGVAMVFIVGGALSAALPLFGLSHPEVRRLN